MTSKYLWLVASSIYIFLGLLHLVYTFFTNRLSPRSESTITEMKNAQLVLTRQTTVWKAWIGFNGSHGLGAVFFGSANLLWALFYFPLLQNSLSLTGLSVLVSLVYLLLAEKYWFNIPFMGLLVATACFLMAIIV